MQPQHLQAVKNFSGGVLCYALGAAVYDKFIKTEATPPKDNDPKVK